MDFLAFVHVYLGIAILDLAFGIWHLAFGIWHLAFGIWHLAFPVQRKQAAWNCCARRLFLVAIVGLTHSPVACLA